MIEPFSNTLLWIVIVSFVIAFFLAFGIGANDVANSFGTSVGAKALTLLQACILATIFEIAGSVLIGYKVSDTMRKGILDMNEYKDQEKELMLGCLSALTSSAIWLLVATFLKLPISGTHSIVGASVGFSLVSKGFSGLRWPKLITIVISWFVSPVLSGVASVIIYLLIKKLILEKKNSFKAGLAALPLFYGFTLLINTFSIIHDGPKLLYLDNVPLWCALVASLGVGIVTVLVVKYILAPWQKKKIEAEIQKESEVNFNIGGSTDTSPEGSPKRSNRNRQLASITENNEMMPMENKGTKKYVFPKFKKDKKGFGSAKAVEIVESTMTPNSSAAPLIVNKAKENGRGAALDPEMQGAAPLENPHVSKLFSYLQVLTAVFGSFAHGGNDVSNAIGPLVAVWLIFKEGSVQQRSETPLYLLIYGGIGISIGLWLWGRRVIETIGEDLTKITPSTGFTIEIGAAFTVLFASKIGLPISTTHCKVGSVVFVGYCNASKRGVDWKLFRNIVYAWVVTVPVTALLSAGCMYLLMNVVPK